MANSLWRMPLLISVASAALATHGSAMAQQANGAVISNDIIVTARRVEERLQNVPISIAVFNQEQLTQRNVSVANELAGSWATSGVAEVLANQPRFYGARLR